MPPTLLTTKEVADYLRVSQATVLRWCKNGQLPAVRIGRQWRISKEHLDLILAGEMPWGTGLNDEG
jgi:excisionase family DNA binding protein